MIFFYSRVTNFGDSGLEFEEVWSKLNKTDVWTYVRFVSNIQSSTKLKNKPT